MSRVLFFARARELAGAREADLAGSTVAEVLESASARYGAEFVELCRTCTVVVDGEVVPRSSFDRAPVGSELGILPPVSGGAGTHHAADAARVLRVAVLTVSDRASAGVYEDLSGPSVEEAAVARLDAEIVRREVVADDPASVAATLRSWCDADVADLVLTTGGTGLGPRDLTPEATRSVLDAEAPGIAELMRSEGRRSTPLAALSRQVAGRRGRTLVVNLPGSVRGATESLAAVAEILPHAVATARGAT